MRFLRNFELDRLSFWIGFLGGILFWWFIARMRSLWPQVIKFIKNQIAATRESLTASTETRLRNETLLYAQHQHLASGLFSLDEILVTPTIMATDPQLDEESEEHIQDICLGAIPYMPDWPEMAAFYKAPTLTLAQALQDGANLLLLGTPGSGKTVALAHLASQICRHDDAAGALGDCVPIYLHAADLVIQTIDRPWPEIIGSTLANYTSLITTSRLPGLLGTAMQNGRALLLLDGVDELNPEAIQSLFVLLSQFFEQYPALRVVVATSPDYYGGLNRLGLVPVALADWSEEEKTKFIEHWGELWEQHISQPGGIEADSTNRVLINGWLADKNLGLTPFELTLRIWAAFAGDSLGAELTGSIEAHIRRLIVSTPEIRPALERVAAQMVLQRDLAPAFEGASKPAIKETPTVPLTSPEEETSAPPEEAKKTERPPALPPELTSLLGNGLLVTRSNSRLAFSHPLFTGYLAFCGMAGLDQTQSLLEQAKWAGRSVTLSFLATTEAITPVVQKAIHSTDLLYHELLQAAGWLRTAPKSLSWRVSLMRALAGTIQKENLATGLAGRLVSALALSGDPGVSTLFGQLLNSSQATIRQLCALGCGLTGDVKNVPKLIELAENDQPDITRAACLALVATGNRAALDGVATILLQSDELRRRIAAEAISMHPVEGRPALEDGSTMEDILVRRSVVFGLLRTRQPWAIQILEKMQVEDEQWLVKTAAAQALEYLNRPNPSIPKPVLPLPETPWLLAYAAKLGMGISPGKPAEELVINTLQSQEERFVLSALDYIRQQADAYAFPAIYQVFFTSEGLIHDAAFNALWHLAASGVEFPDPNQYGFIFQS